MGEWQYGKVLVKSQILKPQNPDQSDTSQR